jgi:capsular exopolysaccharide synthesis family protein
MADVQTLPPPQYPSLTPSRQEVEYVVLADADGTVHSGLQDYLRLFWRRKWLFLLPAVCLLPLIGLFVVTQPQRYSARATVLVEDTTPKVLAIPEVTGPDQSPNFYQTQYELIKSRAVADEVVEKLQLYTLPPAKTGLLEKTTKAIPAFLERVWQAGLALVTPRDREALASLDGVEALPTAPASADLQRQQAVGRLLRELKVQPRKGIDKSATKLVDIIVEGDDPQQAIRQVNAVAATYAQQNLDKRLVASRKASIWLQKEAETLRDRITAGERRIQGLKEDKRLVGMGNETGHTQAADLQSLGTLNLSYLEKRRERLALRAELDELQKFLASPDLTQSAKYPTLVNNTAISTLRMRYTDLQIQATELGKKFMDKHPKMMALTEQIAEVRKAITGEVQRVIASLENQYHSLTTQENELKQFFNTQKSTVIQSEKDVTSYEALRRDLDIQKAMYQELSKRLTETSISTALENNNVTLVETALGGNPISSGALKYLLIGLIFSLGCGGGLTVLVEGLDRRFKNVAEVEQALAVPFLGFIPHHVLPKHRPPALITLQKPWSAVAEAYHTVRTWIQLAQPPVRSLLVTSACAREGKSTTAANLAVSFAQLGRQVLLVDADLRRPSLHRIFGDIQSQGLTDVLARGVEWSSVVHEAPLDNLKILFAGACPLNPTELLSMARLKHLIEHWKARFDLVIFDSPVVLSIPDVMILAPMMDSVLLVHSQGRSTRAMAVETKRLLERAGAKLLGMIFNNVRPKEEHYYSAEYYGSKYSAVVTSGRLQQGTADSAAVLPAIEVSPTVVAPPTSEPAPVVVRREDESEGMHFTLHTVAPRRHIGAWQATAGTVFLVVDVELTNHGAFGHLFDPAQTALTTHAGTDYGRALASFISIHGANDDADMLQATSALRPYDAALTAQVGGLASVVEITADQTRRGSIVYHIPEASGLYTFVYSNPPIALSIPFTLHV